MTAGAAEEGVGVEDNTMESSGVGDSGDFGGLDRSGEELILRFVLVSLSVMLKENHSDDVYGKYLSSNKVNSQSATNLRLSNTRGMSICSNCRVIDRVWWLQRTGSE